MPSLSKYVQFIQLRWAETKKDRGSNRISNDDFGYFSKKFAVEYKLLLKSGQLDDALAGRIKPKDYGKSKVEEEPMDIGNAVKSASRHSVKESTSKDVSKVETPKPAVEEKEEEEPMEVDEQEEIVVEKLENKPADLTQVASNLTNSFIAAGRALSQENLVEEVAHLSEDEDAQDDHEASFNELDNRRASLIDISSQVMLADSDEANKGFLEEQPNFLPENDKEIVQNLIEKSNADQVGSDEAQADIEPFGTEKAHCPADEEDAVEENEQEIEEVETMETEVEEAEIEADIQTAEVESTNSETNDNAESEHESEHESEPVTDDQEMKSVTNLNDLPDAERELEEIANELSRENLYDDNNDSDEGSNSASDDDSASVDTSDASGNLETLDDINLTERDCQEITPDQRARESVSIAPSAAVPSDTIITENTKPVTHLVASFESKMSVESVDETVQPIVPSVAGRAAPPPHDAVDLEEVMPSIEQKSNSDPEKNSRKSFGERIKGLVRCCQQE